MSSNLKALADKGEARCALVPKLRFPDFQDAREWEVSTIGDSKPFVTSGSRGWATFYSENGDLFVRITNLLRDSIYLDLTDSKYVQLPPGANEGVRTQLKEHDVLISITADIGIIGYVDEYIPSPAYINQHIALVRFDEEQLCGKYVAYFLAAEKSQKLFRASTDTGTKAGMSLIGIQKIVIMFPGLPEQQKIADCLSSMDELMAAQARKVDALKTYKKGLMQQLFPRDDETQPRLRFPEFQNAGEWSKMNLGQAAAFYNGRAYKQEELLESGKYPVLRVGNFFTNNNWYHSDLELDQTKYCEKGDLLYALSASFGPRVWRGEKSIYHYHIWKVVEQRGIDKQFLFITLENETENMKAKTTNGLGIMHITKGAIESWETSFPTITEQRKIADCLRRLDNAITGENKKLDVLKIHKKSLIQQLFLSPDAIQS